MGQKTNPKAFRLVTTQKHLSDWYSTKNLYSNILNEDYVIREKIEKNFEDLLEIASIHIARSTFKNNILQDKIFITIKALYPRKKDILKKITNFFSSKESNTLNLLFKEQKNQLKNYFQNILKQKVREIIRFFKKNIHIKLNFVEHISEDVNLIAKYIGKQIKLRIPFRRVIKYTFKKMEYSSINGIKIEVSGRLNGVEIARSEWKRQGKIPLHTLNSNIQYSCYKVETVYGIVGIKVWVYKI